jgi:hypothetical protein
VCAGATTSSCLLTPAHNRGEHSCSHPPAQVEAEPARTVVRPPSPLEHGSNKGPGVDSGPSRATQERSVLNSATPPGKRCSHCSRLGKAQPPTMGRLTAIFHPWWFADKELMARNAIEEALNKDFVALRECSRPTGYRCK